MNLASDLTGILHAISGIVLPAAEAAQSPTYKVSAETILLIEIRLASYSLFD
jgi:hypothetical protein